MASLDGTRYRHREASTGRRGGRIELEPYGSNAYVAVLDDGTRPGRVRVTDSNGNAVYTAVAADLADPEAMLTSLRDAVTGAQTADEVRALADDILITVTNFFRDPHVFEKLAKEVVPKLFEGKEPADDLRVWSVGCATGEEAYSLAILLLEEAAHRKSVPRMQVFASDLHEHSLKKAREGFYSGEIEVSPERLRQFFEKEEGGFRVKKHVREMVVFAPHNLMADPPFSRVDLIACRNVLIYLQRSVQQEVVELFHYALNPSGYLVLGTSETIDTADLFRTMDKKPCFYEKRNVPGPEPRLPVFPMHRRGVQEREGSGDYYFEHAKYALGYALAVVLPERR